VQILNLNKPILNKENSTVKLQPDDRASSSVDDVYDFTANRQRNGPARFLENYAGYLQADAVLVHREMEFCQGGASEW
jgi:hypothetical protein